MNFRDQRVTCSVCEKDFIFTVTEQRQIYASGQADSGLAGIVPPAECPSCRRQEPQTGRASGRIKWFSEEKGHGFIEREGGSDLFVHHSYIRGEGYRSLQAGQSVAFSIESGPSGPQAVDVVVLGP